MIYLIKSTLCMVLLWGFYRLFLQKEKLFLFNRFYLLGSLIFSYVIPKIEFVSNKVNEGFPLNLPYEYDNQIILQEESTWDYMPYIWGIYILMTLFFLFKYIIGIGKMYRRINQYDLVKQKHSSIVLVPDETLPQTFFNYIFLNKEAYINKEIDDSIINHEIAHSKQLHSIDIVFIELLKAIFWFNPVLKLYSHSIRTNHEFLADEFALSKVNNISFYQELLLSSFTPHETTYRFTSSVNYSLTKNRFIMMRKNTPQKTAFIKTGGAFAMLFASFFMFNNSVYAQEGASPEEVQEYNILILDNYDQEGNPVRLSKDEAKRMLVIYNKMDAEQQDVIKGLRLPIPKAGKQKMSKSTTPPPPPPFPHGAKYILDGKEVSVFEANMMLASYKHYDIRIKKGKDGVQKEFHITKKNK